MNDDQWREAWRLCESLSNLSGSEREAILVDNPDAELAGAVISVMHGAESTEASETAALGPSTMIGRYMLREVVGSGGMGLVYAAEDLELGRRVALKFLSQRATASASGTELFVHEAKAASALNHPNIVTVYEIVRSERGVAIAMELVDGISVRRICRDGCQLAEALRYGEQIARALAAAHAQGIVHRDIKPENIMVRPDGYIKVLDFGLARVGPSTAAGLEQVQPEQSSRAGTWRYMSPEQVRGEPITAASDIFSLGLVLYELCAGQYAFPGTTPFGAADAIANRSPDPPSKKNHRITPALERLILAMLNRRAALRPTASEVAHTLQGLLERKRPAEERMRSRRWMAAVVVCLMSVTGAYLWHQATAEHPLSLTQITNSTTENPVTAAAISPDGGAIAYADPDGIFVRKIGIGETQALFAPPHFRSIRIGWLPGERRMLVSGFDVFTLKPALWVVNRSAAPPSRLLQDAADASVSADGRVAFTRNGSSEIWLADRNGSGQRKLVAGSNSDIFPLLFWSADGKRICFERRRNAPLDPDKKASPEFEDRYIFTYESAAADSGRVLAAARSRAMKSACALPDGRVFFTLVDDGRIDNLWQMKTAKGTGARLAPPSQVTHLGRLSKTYGLSASSDGKRMTLVVEGDEPDVYVGDLEQPGPRLVNSRRLTLNGKSDYPHAWTPDSRAVIFESDRNGKYNLFRQDIDSHVAEPFVTGRTDEALAQVTPGGRWVLYSDGKLWERWSLMRVPITGGTPVKLMDLSGIETQYRCPLRSGKSSCVLREEEQDREFVFYDFDPMKGKGRELARTKWIPSFLQDWDISPDGLTVAMPYHDRLPGRIRLVPLDGRRAETEVTITGADTLRSVSWSATGKGWIGAAETGAGDHLVRIDPDGQAHLLRETTNRTFAVPSPDGRHLAFVDDGVDSNVWLIEQY